MSDAQEQYKQRLLETYQSMEFHELYNFFDTLSKKLKHSDSSDRLQREDILLRQELIRAVIRSRESDVHIQTTYQGYPSLDDPEFRDKLNQKFELNTNIVVPKKCSSTFSLTPHQIFLKNLISKSSPYNGILLFHGTGTGKTCTGVTIAENFKDIYGDKQKRIIGILSKNILEGWKQTIYNPKKKSEQCTGLTYNQSIPKKGYAQKVDLQRETNKLIKRHYDFYGYLQFANMVLKGIKAYTKNTKKAQFEEKKKEYIRTLFSDRIVIIDEVHNMRSEDSDGKVIAQVLDDIVTYSQNMKLILLTATPMYNMPNEILYLLNLLRKNDNRVPLNESDIFDSDSNLKSDSIAILKQACTGYVSYIRGENPETFPLRLYPDIDKDSQLLPMYPKKNVFGKPINDYKLSFMKLYGSLFKKHQKKIYLQTIQAIESKDQGLLQLDDEQQCMKISNFAFPNSKNEPLSGRDGLTQCFKINKHRSSEIFTYKDTILKQYGPFLDESLIKNYSSKIHSILKLIRESKGIVFIYSQWIQAGVLPLLLALEQNGYANYNETQHLNYPEWSNDAPKYKTKREPIDYLGKVRSQYSDARSFKQAKYVVISADKSLSKNNTDALKDMFSEKNKHGENIKIIIGTRVASEGIDMKYIRSVHVLDPWHNLNRLEQIIGRAIRFCSHKDLDPQERNVTIYLHVGFLDAIRETTDIAMYRYAERKSVQIGNVETVLKESSVDCHIMKDTNYIKKKDVKRIRYVTARGTKSSLLPYDRPNTKICSFQSKCNYSCSSTTAKELNLDTTNPKLLKPMFQKIAPYIESMFKYKPCFTITDCIETLSFLKVHKYMIYMTIDYMINEPHIFYNTQGVEGKLIYKNEFYIFQPSYLINESAPLYYRNLSEKMKQPTHIKPKIIKRVQTKKTYDTSSIKTMKRKRLDVAWFKTNSFYKRFPVILSKSNNDILLQYMFERLSLEDKLSYLYQMFYKTQKNIKPTPDEKIIFKLISKLLMRNLIYKEGDVYDIDVESPGRKIPIGCMLNDSMKRVYFLWNSQTLELNVANELITKRINSIVKDKQTNPSFKQYYLNVTEPWTYSIKEGKYNEKTNLKIVFKISSGLKGYVTQGNNSIVSLDEMKQRIRNEIGNVPDEYLRVNKQYICNLHEIILRIKTKQQSKKSFLSYDQVAMLL
jgi:hypothetical protein